jgi:rhamnulokinase
LINMESMEANITNEGSVENKYRLLKNIDGLWFLQECKRQWSRLGRDYAYKDLIQMAARSPSFGPLIIPSDNSFLSPHDMVQAIQLFCKKTGQEIPIDKGAIIRCILESLALEYRLAAEQIDTLTNESHPVIHIIGGGSKNSLLNKLTADATGRTVYTGPVEATAIGNILVQAIASGDVNSLAEGREIVRKSFSVGVFEPSGTTQWDDAYEKYKALKN